MKKERKSNQRKEKKRRRSYSFPRSPKDEQSRRLEKRLEEERSKKKEEARLQKKAAKAIETAEEKMVRRMQKKMRKDEKRREAVTDSTLMPPELNYTNLNNPFNDTKLMETFVWGKKLEKEGKIGLSKEELKKEANQRIYKNLTEVSEFKRKRDSRAAQKEDIEMMKRDADMRAGQISDSKECEFQLDQIKERTRIRIDQGRAKAIDFLIRYARFADQITNSSTIIDFDIEKTPLDYLKSTCKSVDDFEDLIEDIKTYRELDGLKKRETWWLDITRIAEEEIQKTVSSNRGEVHASIGENVRNMCKGQNMNELVKLQNQIQDKLRTNNGNIEYWQNVDRQFKLFMARKRIRENHQKVCELQLTIIKQEQMKEIQWTSQNQKVEARVSKRNKSEEYEKEDQENEDKLLKKVRRKVDIEKLDDEELDEQERELKWRALTEEQLEDATLELYRIGSYSPSYNNFNDTMPGIEVIDVQVDAENLIERRNRNLGDPSSTSSTVAAGGSEVRMLDIARQGMGDDELMFSVEEQLKTQKYLWSDKYRPRKPTYCNRVQNGFDWNKYNQTHYDQDNPPPKIVQGYKFNIFYPDLLDPKVAPTHELFECENDDFAVIRFSAGPPYEDIAFKIVRRDWDTLEKNGYKCLFRDGVFQLWFMFKKYRYRR